jgi:hypothetical protein
LIGLGYVIIRSTYRSIDRWIHKWIGESVGGVVSIIIIILKARVLMTVAKF